MNQQDRRTIGVLSQVERARAEGDGNVYVASLPDNDFQMSVNGVKVGVKRLRSWGRKGWLIHEEDLGSKQLYTLTDEGYGAVRDFRAALTG